MIGLTVAVGLVFATTWVNTDNSVLVILIGVAGMVGLGLLNQNLPLPRVIPLVLAGLAVLLVAPMSVAWLWSSVLERRGVEVTATVIEIRDGSGKGRELRYSLLGPDGNWIPGELTWWPGAVSGASGNPEGSVGDPVTVVVDPKGLVHPRLPEELAAQTGVGPATVGGFLVIAGLCMLAGRPRPGDPARWARPGDPAGRTGPEDPAGRTAGSGT